MTFRFSILRLTSKKQYHYKSTNDFKLCLLFSPSAMLVTFLLCARVCVCDSVGGVSKWISKSCQPHSITPGQSARNTTLCLTRLIKVSENDHSTTVSLTSVSDVSVSHNNALTFRSPTPNIGYKAGRHPRALNILYII